MRRSRQPFIDGRDDLAWADRREAGMSLIALLVVILILGVMSVIALASLGSTGDTVRHGTGTEATASPVAVADSQACKASAKEIENAALAYYVGHNEMWPPDIATLSSTTPPYLKDARNPKWGLAYDSTTGKIDASACDR